MTGQGLVGVRVSVDRTNNANNYGFTLTRPGGWYVLLVAFVSKKHTHYVNYKEAATKKVTCIFKVVSSWLEFSNFG